MMFTIIYVNYQFVLTQVTYHYVNADLCELGQFEAISYNDVHHCICKLSVCPYSSNLPFM